MMNSFLERIEHMNSRESKIEFWSMMPVVKGAGEAVKAKKSNEFRIFRVREKLE